MSCGTRLQGRFYGYYEREELADKIRDEGDYRLSGKVRRQECLDYGDLHRANNILSEAGMSRYHDYKEEQCHCEPEEEQF